MIAVDTNVLIHACDQADPRRQKVALDLITSTPEGLLLWQVAPPRRVPGFAPLVQPTDANLVRAKVLHLARGASFWDALVLAACVEAGIETF